MRALALSTFLSLALVAAGFGRAAHAHDPGLSAATVVLEADGVFATLRLNAEDLPTDPALREEWLVAPLEISSHHGPIACKLTIPGWWPNFRQLSSRLSPFAGFQNISSS